MVGLLTMSFTYNLYVSNFSWMTWCQMPHKCAQYTHEDPKCKTRQRIMLVQQMQTKWYKNS